MTPEIIENGKHQPVGDYNNNLRLDPEILDTSVDEEKLFLEGINEINEKYKVTGGKRKSRKLKKSKKKTIKRKSTKRKY